MVSEQVDPPGSILWMGPPLASVAILPIARLGRAPFFCLPRAHGTRHCARRFCARRAALQAARRPALPVVRPVARDVTLPVARPEACGGFVACRGAPGAHAPPLLSPVAAPWGGRASPPPVARRGAIGGPRATPSLPSPIMAPSGAARRPTWRPQGPTRPPLLSPVKAPSGGPARCPSCSPRAARAASCPRATAGRRSGARGVCRGSEARGAAGGVNGSFGTVKGRLGGGSRRVASSASSPEATISGSPASLLRQSPLGPLLLPLRVSRGASYSSSPEATISGSHRARRSCCPCICGFTRRLLSPLLSQSLLLTYRL
ncbi:unnamed protein product [Closterium sp. NIES-53]